MKRNENMKRNGGLEYINDTLGIIDKIENIRLLKLAERRADSKLGSFEEFVSEQGFSMDELEEMAESVEFE